MSLKSLLSGKVEDFAIGFFLRGIESGRYGSKLKAVWFSLKGKKTLIGWTLFAIGGAVTAYPDTSVVAFGTGLAILGSYLGRFGLVAKGSDHTLPVSFPEEYRNIAQAALSVCTYLIEVLTGLSGLLMMSDSEWTRHVSFYSVIAAQGLSTATGYLATLIGPTPKQAAVAAIAIDVKAVKAAEVVVDEAKADVAASVDIAADVAAKPKAKKPAK